MKKIKGYQVTFAILVGYFAGLVVLMFLFIGKLLELF